MRSSDDLEATNDNLYLKQRKTLVLNNLLNSSEDSELRINRDTLLVVVENTSENMSELNDSYHLSDEVFADFVEGLLEE